MSSTLQTIWTQEDRQLIEAFKHIRAGKKDLVDTTSLSENVQKVLQEMQDQQQTPKSAFWA